MLRLFVTGTKSSCRQDVVCGFKGGLKGYFCGLFCDTCNKLYNNYPMNPSWIWSDKITNERVARVGYYHFISNKGEWNNCFSKFSTRVLFSSSFYCYNAVSYVQRMTTLIRQCQRMTVKLQELAIKSELKVAMRYQNSKTVAMRCKNRCYVKFKNL